MMQHNHRALCCGILALSTFFCLEAKESEPLSHLLEGEESRVELSVRPPIREGMHPVTVPERIVHDLPWENYAIVCDGGSGRQIALMREHGEDAAETTGVLHPGAACSATLRPKKDQESDAIRHLFGEVKEVAGKLEVVFDPPLGSNPI